MGKLFTHTYTVGLALSLVNAALRAALSIIVLCVKRKRRLKAIIFSPQAGMNPSTVPATEVLLIRISSLPLLQLH